MKLFENYDADAKDRGGAFGLSDKRSDELDKIALKIVKAIIRRECERITKLFESGSHEPVALNVLGKFIDEFDKLDMDVNEGERIFLLTGISTKENQIADKLQMCVSMHQSGNGDGDPRLAGMPPQLAALLSQLKAEHE